MHILGIDGSPKRGIVSALLDEALHAAREEAVILGEEHIEVEALHLADLDLPHHDGSYDSTPPELALPFDWLRKADGIIFATPVHWFNVSELTKCFIDWLTTLEANFELEGKVAGVIAHCDSDGGNQAAMSLVGPLLHMGLMIPPCCAMYRNKCLADLTGHEWQGTDQRLVGQNVLRLARTIRTHQGGWSLRKEPA